MITAHHYRAFNLDWIAEDQPTIEGEYQRAIDLNPRHPWWHSRWINYLITVGKHRTPLRICHKATEGPRRSDGVAPGVCLSVAPFVGRGFASSSRTVGVREAGAGSRPRGCATRTPGLCSPWRKTGCNGGGSPGTWCLSPVRPGQPPLAQIASPRFPTPRGRQGTAVVVSCPCGVGFVSAEAITLIVGKPSEGGAPPSYGRIILSADRFDSATLDESTRDLRPGRFLELAFFGDEGILKIRSHPQETWEDSDLPYLNPPDTLRYLRRQERPS